MLAQHPEAMAKLEAELDAAGLLVTTERPQPRPFDFADISKLHYLDCVIKVRLAAQRIAGLCLLRLAFPASTQEQASATSIFGLS